MEQLTEVYVGPGSTGGLSVKTIKEVLKRHDLAFNFKEMAWMYWGDEPEIGLIFQVEGGMDNIENAIEDIRQTLGVDRVSVLYPGDLDG